MFKQYAKLLASIDVKAIAKAHCSSPRAANQAKEKWDLIAAVCLERKPVLAPPLNKLESDYAKLMSDLEFEHSLKCDHEVRHEKEQKQLEALKQGTDVDVHLKQTAQDILDANIEELNKFQFSSRLTEADEKNDVKSLERKLDKHLVLVIGQKLGKDKFYLLPQRPMQVGETLRQTAERALKETCTGEVKASIYGNAPSSFYKYKYPKSVQNETVGAKVFIYFARYLNGQLPSQGVDFKWLDRQELSTILPKGYKDSVQQMLIDEDR